jgi:hypothetical protein
MGYNKESRRAFVLQRLIDKYFEAINDNRESDASENSDDEDRDQDSAWDEKFKKNADTTASLSTTDVMA